MGVNKSTIQPGARNVLDAALGPVHRPRPYGIECIQYIRCGMAYGRPPRGHRIPTAAQTKTYIAYIHLALPCFIPPSFRSFLPVLHFTLSPVIFPSPPTNLLFEPSLREPLRRRNATLHCRSLSLCLLDTLVQSIYLSLQYPTDTCHDLATISRSCVARTRIRLQNEGSCPCFPTGRTAKLI